MMVGEVSTHSANIQVRLTRTEKLVDRDVPGTPGSVEFSLQPSRQTVIEPIPATKSATAAAENDYIARVTFSGLDPDTEYTCRSLIGPDTKHLRPGPIATFRTHAGPEIASDFSFVVVTGMNYGKFHGVNGIDKKNHRARNNTSLPAPYEGPDKHLGYPALESILKLKPDFFVGTGDNVYYDTPKDPRAKTVSELRQKWHEQFVQPRYRSLFASVPTYWEIDDHDYRKDDCDNSGDYAPSVQVAKRLMLEQLPYGPMNDTNTKTYRTYRVSRDLQIWFVEGRIYRSDNRTPESPEKTIWGKEQKAWLKRTLQESTATYKVLISPTPMIGPDDLRKKDNHTNIGGFRHERDDFFAFIKSEQIKNFYLVCGDRHWQYHAVDPRGPEEFSSGALVDVNSRLGRKAGDPKSTDPEATIKQPYLQNPASGGFLHVTSLAAQTSQAAQLIFQHRDEHGKLLNQVVK